MRHALRMQEIERGRNVAHNYTRLALRQVTALLDVRKQRSALHLLEHHIELLLFFEELDNLENVGTLAAMQIDLDLLEDALSVRVRVLVDDLDGVLGARVDVAAREHLTVGAATQYLARQRVNVREACRLHVRCETTLLLACHCPIFGRSIIITIIIRSIIVYVNVLDITRSIVDRFVATTIGTTIYNVYANTGTFMIAFVIIEQSIIVIVSIMAVGGENIRTTVMLMRMMVMMMMPKMLLLVV